MYGGKGHFQYSKGNNSKTRKTRVTVNVFCMSSHGVNICVKFHENMSSGFKIMEWTPGRVAQSVGHLTRKSGVLGSIPSLATYFRFSFRFFKKDSCQLLAKVCARSTG